MKTTILLLAVLLTHQAFSQITISEARNSGEGSTVTISGIVTSGNELGKIRYMQDATAGIAVYDDKLSAVKRGDSITIKGELKEYNNLLEVDPVESLTVHSSGNVLPVPVVLTIDDIGEEYEGQLIRINDVEFVNPGGTFAGNTNYEFTDGTKTGELRINTSSPIVGEAMPTGKFSLVAICSQYSWEPNNTRTGYQLLPRDMDDFISSASFQFVSPVEVGNITQNSVQLSWATDAGVQPYVRYGSANNESALTNYVTGDFAPADGYSLHVAEITGLEPAEVIYAQAFNVGNGDTIFSSVAAYVTASNSSGKIHVYFNSAVNRELATETVAQNIGNAMEDTLAAYIGRATESIDLCVYSYNNSTVSDALNAAHDRGVKVRFITCESTGSAGLSDLDPGIPVLERPELQQGGIMHNKFAVIDANSPDAHKSWVWSGSTNLTSGQLFSDANNMIFIQDQSLAQTYKIEFEEMWGGSGSTPNLLQSKFGEEKTDNTPHELLIAGNRVECYFSPSDNTNQKLIDAMNTADENLDVETMIITRSDLAYTLSDVHNRGVEVSVITDDRRNNSETANEVLDTALPAGKYIFDDMASGILHHKVALIDARATGSDPQVITGSHNWSNSANDRNDENTLIIHNADVANQYYQQFAHRFVQNGGKLVVSLQQIEESNLNVFPNPTARHLTVAADKPITKIQLFSVTGKKTGEWAPTKTNRFVVDLSDEKAGIFLLQVETGNGRTNTYKILKK